MSKRKSPPQVVTLPRPVLRQAFVLLGAYRESVSSQYGRECREGRGQGEYAQRLLARRTELEELAHTLHEALEE